jgi:hypothetical protein
METNELIDALKRRGHFVGKSAISPDGFLLLNIDWKLMKKEDAEKLLSTKQESTRSR